MPDVQVDADRLAHLEAVAAAAEAWLRSWTSSQSSGRTELAFGSSKRLAEAIRSTAVSA